MGGYFIRKGIPLFSEWCREMIFYVLIRSSAILRVSEEGVFMVSDALAQIMPGLSAVIVDNILLYHS